MAAGFLLQRGGQVDLMGVFTLTKSCHPHLKAAAAGPTPSFLNLQCADRQTHPRIGARVALGSGEVQTVTYK